MQTCIASFPGISFPACSLQPTLSDPIDELLGGKRIDRLKVDVKLSRVPIKCHRKLPRCKSPCVKYLRAKKVLPLPVGPRTKTEREGSTWITHVVDFLRSLLFHMLFKVGKWHHDAVQVCWKWWGGLCSSDEVYIQFLMLEDPNRIQSYCIEPTSIGTTLPSHCVYDQRHWPQTWYLWGCLFPSLK